MSSDGQVTPPPARLFVDDGDVRHESVRVAIRVRPLNERERLIGARQAWRITDGKLIERTDEPQHQYAFDHVFDETQSTESVYQTIAASVVNSSMQGINGTIFAYGQTSSGKTHTMLGTRESPGIIPFALSDIFQFIQQNEDREFLLRVSHIEIYNEVIRDLLNPENANLKVQENANGNIVIGRLTEVNVRSPVEVMGLLLKGQASRQTAATNMNEESSRSHSIFRLAIESRERQQEGQSPDQVDGGVQIASLNLVDLAGSERVATTGATGMRLKEGGHINKSLLTLGKCIRLLSEGNSCRHIPFRDSKLTRILAPALGGNSFTVIVCAVTPASVHIEETISTINFASRAKTIQNVVKKNEIVDEQTQIHRLQKEIANLKSRLRRSDESDDFQRQCEDKARQLEEAQSQFERLRKLFLHANNLDLDIAQNSIITNSARNQDPKRSAILRRRTVDPATFSLQNASKQLKQGQTPFRSQLNAMGRNLEPVVEHQSGPFSGKSAQCMPEIGTEQESPPQKDNTRIADDEVFRELEFLRKENQSIRDRCARAETNLQMAEFDVKKAENQYEALQQKLLQERNAASHIQAEMAEKFENAIHENDKLMKMISRSLKSEQNLTAQNLSYEEAVPNFILNLEKSQCEIEANQRFLFDVEAQMSLHLVRMQNRLECSEQLLADRNLKIDRMQMAFDEKLSLSEQQRQELHSRLLSMDSSMHEEITGLSESITRLQEENASLTSELFEAKQRYDQVAALSASKQEQFFRSANEKALKKAESEIDRLKSKIRSYDESSTQSRKEIMELKNQRASLERNIKMMERQISSRENEIVAARNAAESLIALQKQIKKIESSEERWKQQDEEHRRQILAVTDQFNITQAQLERCELELQAARNQLSAAEQGTIASQNATRSLREEFASLQASYQTSQQKLADSCTELDNLRNELNAVTKQLQLAEANRNDAEESAVQAHFHLEEVSLQLKDKLSKEEEQNKALMSQLSALQQQNEQMHQNYDSLVGSSKEQNSAFQQLSDVESSLRAEVDGLRSALQRTEDELHSVQQQLSSLTAQSQTELEDRNSVQLQLELSQKESNDLRAKNNMNVQNCSKLTDELNRVLMKLQETEIRESECSKRNTALEEKLSNLLRENQQLHDSQSPELDSVTVQSLRRELTQLQNDIKVKSDALKEANQKLVLVQKNNDKKVNKIMQKFKEYTRIKNICSNCGAQRDDATAAVSKSDPQQPKADKGLFLDKENHV